MELEKTEATVAVGVNVNNPLTHRPLVVFEAVELVVDAVVLVEDANEEEKTELEELL